MGDTAVNIKLSLQFLVILGATPFLAALTHSAPVVTGPVPGAPTIQVDLKIKMSQRGFTEQEYFFSGDAKSYRSDGDLPKDGRVNAKAADSAPYRTRLLVRRPSDPSKFNGTVVVEWLNVSLGTDLAPTFDFVHREIVRSGFAWVGVSAQKVGIDGSGDASQGPKSLKKADPQRYSALVHPGDAYSFDIFSQAAQVIRGVVGAGSVLGPLKPRHLLAVGESQSAFYLVTYVDAIDPLARVYDGYLIHARGASSPQLTGSRSDSSKGAVLIRSDVRVPVLEVQSETDVLVLNSLPVRQPDSAKFRLWEIAGASHGDTYEFDVAFQDTENIDPAQLAKAIAPTKEFPGLMKFDTLINSGPQQHYIMQAALNDLNRWAAGGPPPPHAPRLEVSGDPPAFVLDGNGIARGGIRTGWVDVPIARLSGLGQTGESVFSKLFGTTQVFGNDKLKQLYPGGEHDYTAKFEASTRAAIAAGFILAADEKEINALAAASWPPTQQ